MYSTLFVYTDQCDLYHDFVLAGHSMENSFIIYRSCSIYFEKFVSKNIKQRLYNRDLETLFNTNYKSHSTQPFVTS